VDALAASAASVIAMAGDEIRMAKNALMMVHEAWGFTQGDAREHDKTAALLRKMSENAADIYTARTAQKRDDVLEWMADETWFTADEALELGFATKVHPAKQAPRDEKKAAAAWKPEMAAQMFRRMPERLRQELAQRLPGNMARESNAQPNAKPALVPTALGKLAWERSRARLGDI
jgi:enoyl-CoA hydratase/carnithine racemase